LWIGDPAEIEAKRVKKRKTDREDARLLLRLMREDRFPQIWVPSPENRDLRQLLWHRHRLVQMRTRIMNQLQALAMNEGKRWKSKLFSQKGRAEFEKLALGPWASRRFGSLFDFLLRGRRIGLYPWVDCGAPRSVPTHCKPLLELAHVILALLQDVVYYLCSFPPRFPPDEVWFYVSDIPFQEK
jgi:hypothetical protein